MNPIPLARWSRWRRECYCGERFWSGRAYRGHYALVHLLGLR